MVTGILGYKGRVIFTAGDCINDQLDAIDKNADRQECIHAVAVAIDKTIHRGYHIFPCNYIAYDRVEKTDRFAGLYTDEDVKKFDNYLNGQLDKVELTDVSDEERAFMADMIHMMYANPLRNKLAAEQ